MSKTLLQLALLFAIAGGLGAVGLSIAFTVDVAWKMHLQGHNTFALFWTLWGSAWVVYWVGKTAQWAAAPLEELRKLP